MTRLGRQGLPPGVGQRLAAKAATSIIPAPMPGVVRTSVNPNRPAHSDSR